MLTVSYLIILTNGGRECVGGVRSEMHRQTPAHWTAYQIPRPPSFMQRRSQLRGVGFGLKPGVHATLSTFISAWKTALHYPSHKNRKTQRCEIQDFHIWQSVSSIIYVNVPSIRESLNIMWNMQSDRPVAGNFRWTYLLSTHAWPHTYIHTYLIPLQWLTMCCWFYRQVKWGK